MASNESQAGAQHRLEVLSRQFTAGLAMEQSSSPSSSQPVNVCPKQMNSFIVHDNKELREAIYEFLKVGRL
jgi:hypothetical protein